MQMTIMSEGLHLNSNHIKPGLQGGGGGGGSQAFLIQPPLVIVSVPCGLII